MMLGIGNGIKRIALLSSLLLLASCGFQLAGAGRLPAAMESTWLSSVEPRSEFSDSLREALRLRGLRIVDERAEGGATLSVSEDATGQRILSVSARNIPREYEVFYRVTFSLEADGRELISNEPLLVRRNYTYDETQVLGKEREEDQLRRALAEELARQVVRLIEAAASSGNQSPG
jgi:LPS-assembly lipoprotein